MRQRLPKVSAHGGSDRRALHVAQAIRMAYEHGSDGYLASPPERPYYEVRSQAPPRIRRARIAAVSAAAIALTVGIGAAARRG